MSDWSRRLLLRGSLALAGLGVLSGCGRLPWPAQPKVPRIGYLSNGSASTDAVNLGALRQGLTDLGYREGETIVVEVRHADGRAAELPALAAELLDLKVDILVTNGTPTAQAAKGATDSTPIVAISGDPVEAGLVASLARPGANLTGLTVTVAGRVGKRLDLLKEAVPTVSRVAILGNAANAAHSAGNAELQQAAPRLGVEVLTVDVGPSVDLEAVLGAALRDRPDSLMVQDDPAVFARRDLILRFAAQHRLPTMYQRREWADQGGLLSYGANFPSVFRRAATYVDRILKGASPADLPVEQPTTFDFVVSLKTAQALGLTIPPSVLQQATEVIP